MGNIEKLPAKGFGIQEVQILEAFLAFCFNHGVEEVTQQKIAAEAKVALATLQYYFGKGKPGLTESALRHVATVGQDATARGLLREMEKKLSTHSGLYSRHVCMGTEVSCTCELLALLALSVFS